MLTCNRLFNFIIGARGVGKTYGMKKFLINKYLRSGKTFIYLRRYNSEFKKIKRFFTDIQAEFPENTLKVTNNFLVDNMVCGGYMALSTAKNDKSVPFSDVGGILFDEFVLDKGPTRYLPNEVSCFLDAYSTISRSRDIPVYFLSNALTEYNPYFLYFNIEPPKEGIKLYGDILVENIKAPEYVDFMHETRFGKLIKGTDYGDYAISNEYLHDDTNFIQKKSGKLIFMFNIIVDGFTFGLWKSADANTFFISEDYMPNSKLNLTIALEDFKPETQYRDNFALSLLIKTFKSGNLYYENQKVKTITKKIFRKVII